MKEADTIGILKHEVWNFPRATVANPEEHACLTEEKALFLNERYESFDSKTPSCQLLEKGKNIRRCFGFKSLRQFLARSILK